MSSSDQAQGAGVPLTFACGRSIPARSSPKASPSTSRSSKRNLAALRHMLPWLADDFDELNDVFGDDPWPYGVEANRKTLATMMQYMVEQGVLKAELPVEDLFVPVREIA